MELVYLWVEKYKNIHRQGFNFSPKFNCEFKAEYEINEEYEVEIFKDNYELTIRDNQDYIPDFFGKNINITAIVGKNGSGKSSILKLIMMLIFYNKYDSLSSPENEEEKELYGATETIFNSLYYNSFCIIHTSEGFKKIQFQDGIENIIYNEESLKIKNLNSEEIDFFTIHFNYMLDTLYDGNQDLWIKSIYHKADSYETPLLLEPYKNNNDKQLIDLDVIEYLNNQNILRFYSTFEGKKILVDFFEPNKISLLFGKITVKVLKQVKDDYEFVDKNTYKLVDKYFKLISNSTIHKKNKMFAIQTKIESLYDNSQYENINILYVAFKILSSNKELFDAEIYMELTKWIEDEISSDNLIPRDILMDNHNFKELFKQKYKLENYEIRKIKSCIKFIEEDIEAKDTFINAMSQGMYERSYIEELKHILEFIPPWVDVEWFEDQKSIKSLSSGEKSFFTFIINLMYQAQNIESIEKYKTINLFLDETELGFHPQWQKEYLRRIVIALKIITTKKVNLIFATHSPFLLSDIPKKNIIFLKDGKLDNGTKHSQTFGANIHTLLSDSFFMDEGLMGEFAKGKINEIIDFYKEVEEENKKKKSNSDVLITRYEKKRDEFYQTQSIIGEAYLKQIVENHLLEIDKILLGKDRAKEELVKRKEQELERLKNG